MHMHVIELTAASDRWTVHQPIVTATMIAASRVHAHACAGVRMMIVCTRHRVHTLGASIRQAQTKSLKKNSITSILVFAQCALHAQQRCWRRRAGMQIDDAPQCIVDNAMHATCVHGVV